MEAYFHNDPRIGEWIDQITEKVFTVCLLTGVDSETEFQRGCQIVAKVTASLQEISTFPTEFLADGLKQLLEQQLPDERVIENFPTFHDTLDKMLREGLLKAIDNQNNEDQGILTSLEKNNSNRENTRKENTELQNNNTEGPEDISNKEFVTEHAISALAAANTSLIDMEQIVNELGSRSIEPTEPMAIANQNSFECAPSADDNQAIPSKPYGLVRTSQVPEPAERLKRVLNDIFPNCPIHWNMNLGGQNFLAQVEDILIYLHDPEQPFLSENFNRQGWKVLVFSSEDLTFPRRLEREIRQIQRSRKKPLTV